MKRAICLTAMLALLLTGCKGASVESASHAAVDSAVLSYHQISQEEARQMMKDNPDSVIVDVRRQDEYDTGHIPGAVLIPNEDIADTPPAGLPDKDQILLIYCRSGRRSREAAEKLAAMGYTNIYEFGGINTWEGEIVTQNPSDLSIDAEDSSAQVSFPGPEGTYTQEACEAFFQKRGE